MRPPREAGPEGRIPVAAGVGLRAPHYRELLQRAPEAGWLEAHSENYFGAGGAPLHYLEALRADCPLSLHGVGLSLGSADGLSASHLRSLKSLVERVEPGLLSEHLSWSAVDGVYVNDLLPLPYTRETLDRVCAHVDQAQDFLARRLLIENPSSYLDFTGSEMPEPAFLAELVRRTGCGLLLDINNVYVSAHNLGWDARGYLADIPAAAVEEVHLAGHATNRIGDGHAVLIDDHGSQVCDAVWDLYRSCVELIGPRPVLVEWDTRIPALDVLLAEAARAAHILEGRGARVA